jgi:hypothetical protein
VPQGGFQVHATLWSFRIFTGKDYYHRPLPTFQTEYERAGCRISLQFGEIPSEVIAAWKARRETFQRYIGNDEPEEAELPEQWTTQEVFTTVRAHLPIEVSEIEPDHPLASKFFWYSFADMHRIREEVAGRIPDALDDGSASAYKSLGSKFMYGVAEGQGGLFVEAEGKPLSALMHERALGGRGISTRPVSELPTENPLPVASAGRGALAVGRWVSRMYEEPDPFKGFLWAYAGLEVAINRTVSQVDRNRVTEALHRMEGDAPLAGGPCIRELIWPSAFKDSQGADPARDPQRNTSFGFAVLSLLTDPEHADDDVATFKSVQAFRNRIHGERIDEEEAERFRRDAISLFRRYAYHYLNL